MDFTPRYNQPFTLGEAIQLDISVITEEISRLHNSLLHLRRTQAELQAAAEAEPDPEFTKAIEENEVVIGSQEERISILRMALTERGVRMGSHYDINPATSNGHDLPTSNRSETTTTPAVVHLNGTSATNAPLQTSISDDEGGIHL